jgi:hypothetical protein
MFEAPISEIGAFSQNDDTKFGAAIGETNQYFVIHFTV